MMRRLLASTATFVGAIGLGVMLAPTAGAQDYGLDMAQYHPCNDRFRLPWEPPSLTTDVVLSPFGTSDIYCASWHGVTETYQVDPWGNKHRIDMARFITIPLNFYVWDPAAF